MTIPQKIENLIYSRHANRERFNDLKGIIEAVPRSFYYIGCKSVHWKEPGKLEVRYVYDDSRDIILIVIPDESLVVTVWLEFSNNNGSLRGRFRINFQSKNKPLLFKKIC